MNAPNPKFPVDRCPGLSYDDILNLDSKPVPESLREGPAPALGMEPVAARRYFDPAFFQKEIEHVWLRTWQMACREEELPNPGDFVTYDLVGRSLLITRTPSGEINAFHNSCLHRGRKLATGSGCKSEFRCPYHGLTWNTDGSFKANPINWDFPQLKDEAMSLPQARVGTWGGFVFVNFDANAPALESVLQPMQQHFERWRLEDCYKAVHVQKVFRANWKVVAEAFMESHHSVTTHPQFMPFLADVNSQYDILSDHITRQFSAGMMPSPLANREYSQTEILIAGLGGRAVVEAMGLGDLQVPEGMTARAYAGELRRQAMTAEDGYDYSDTSDAELLDALLYNLFPNMSFWAGSGLNLTYRWRPNGLDTETSIMDVYLLKRVPKNGERPRPVPVHVLAPDESWSSAAELGAFGGVFDQDSSNLPYVQEGLHASQTGVVHFSRYSEMRIRKLHQMIDHYLAEGEQVAAHQGCDAGLARER